MSNKRIRIVIIVKRAHTNACWGYVKRSLATKLNKSAKRLTQYCPAPPRILCFVFWDNLYIWGDLLLVCCYLENTTYKILNNFQGSNTYAVEYFLL